MAETDLLKDLVTLPEAAARLGVHRATANDMVRDGRLTGYRLGPHWYVKRSELEVFASHYQRPRNSPRRRNGEWAFHWTNELLRWLLHWEAASSDELARVVDLHVGNVRKYMAFCEQEGLAERDEYAVWRLTPAGRERASRLPPIAEAAS